MKNISDEHKELIDQLSDPGSDVKIIIMSVTSVTFHHSNHVYIYTLLWQRTSAISNLPTYCST